MRKSLFIKISMLAFIMLQVQFRFGHAAEFEIEANTRDIGRVSGTPITQDKVIKIVQSENSTYWLKQDGSLWGAGYKPCPSGLCGGGSADTVSTPVLLMTDVRDVAASNGVLAVKKNGELWGWRFSNSRFGIEADKANLLMEDVVAAQFAYGNGIVALRHDTTLWAWNTVSCSEHQDSSDEPMQLLSNVVSFSGEGSLILAVDTKNRLWGWGQNDFGRLLPLTQKLICSPKVLRKDVIAAEANQFEILYVKKDGTLMRQGINETLLFSDEAWSQNIPSPLHAMQAKKVKDVKGEKPYSFRSVDDKLWTRFYTEPFAECIDKTKTIGKDATEVKIDKKLETVEFDYYFAHKGITFLVSENVADYAVQESAMFVVKKDGTLWGCGSNTNGELGLGDTQPRRQFTQIHLPSTPENTKGVFDQ